MATPRRPFLPATILLLLAAFAAPAQPGNEGQIVRHRVESLRERIADAGRRLASDPRNPALHAARGSLYADLYHALYADHYGRFYRDKSPDLTVPALTASAIADFDRAIELDPSAALYDRRGEMYGARWAATAESTTYNVWHKLISPPGDVWEMLAAPPREGRELAALARYLSDPDFAAAARDYAEALRRGPDPRLASSVHAKFGRLHLTRAEGVPLGLAPVKRAVDGPNPHGYSLWSDYDRALEHLARSEHACLPGAPPGERPWFCAPDVSLSRTYFLKAMALLQYGRDRPALDALTAAEKHLDPYRFHTFYSDCELFTERARVRNRLGDFDGAIRDASRPALYGGWEGVVCGRAYEARGDAHLGKGDWRAAVEDYSAGLAAGIALTTPAAHRGRALAYEHLGEFEKAVEDVRQYFARSFGEVKPEDLLLRARLHRKAGQTALAEEFERGARAMVEGERTKGREVYVFGEIRMPAGVAFDASKVEVRFVDEDDPKRSLWTTVGEGGRFWVTYEQGRTFRIHVYHEGNKDGRAVRFYGRTPKLTTRGKVGPLTITLDRVVPPE